MLAVLQNVVNILGKIVFFFIFAENTHILFHANSLVVSSLYCLGERHALLNIL